MRSHAAKYPGLTWTSAPSGDGRPGNPGFQPHTARWAPPTAQATGHDPSHRAAREPCAKAGGLTGALVSRHRGTRRCAPHDLGGRRFSASPKASLLGCSGKEKTSGSQTPRHTHPHGEGGQPEVTCPGSQQVATVLQGQVQSPVCGGSDRYADTRGPGWPGTLPPLSP